MADAGRNPPADEKPKRLRLFVAINLPEEIKLCLADLQAQAGQTVRKSVRWTRPEQLHLTLKFLAHLDEEVVPDLSAALARACDGVRAFALRAETVGCFPRPSSPRVVWAGINGDLPALLQLQKQIDDATASWREPEKRAFTAHLTIGRVTEANQTQREAIKCLIEKHQNARFGEWTVRTVDLMQSRLSPTGSTYSRLQSFELK